MIVAIIHNPNINPLPYIHFNTSSYYKLLIINTFDIPALIGTLINVPNLTE